MIPVFSYILLKGRCRKCSSKIPVRYLFVELFGGILAVQCAASVPLDESGAGIYLLKTVFLLITGALLTAVTFVDIDTMEIPNGFVLALACLGACLLYTSRCV